MRRRQKANRKKKATARTKLRLPDLDHARAGVLNSLRSPESQRSYRHAIDEFISWYCSEPRLSFNKTVVTRYRIHLESRFLAPGTINGRLAAVRRLAYEAADAGLLSPELAASIRRVKGPKTLGIRVGNWLTANEAKSLWQAPSPESLKGKRDRALLATLLGCGLRRRELADLSFGHLQRRDEHWAIVDLVGKGGHIRTIPVPEWVKRLIGEWSGAAGVESGRVFRCVCKAGKAWGDGITRKRSSGTLSKSMQQSWALPSFAPHDLSPLVRPAMSYCRRRAGTDPVLAWSCFGPDYGEIPRLQTANPGSGERSYRH